METIYKLFDHKNVQKKIELSVELINKSNIENYDVSRWQ